MTDSEIKALLDNYAMWNTQPIADALNNTVSLLNANGENQTGIIIPYGNTKYIVTLSPLAINGRINAISNIKQAKTFSGSIFNITLAGSSGNISIYKATNLQSFKGFTWYTQTITEGLEITTIGDQTDTFKTLYANYSNMDLNFSVTEGFIARMNSDINASFGNPILDTGPYIRHTGIINPLGTIGRGGSFGGPLLTIDISSNGILYPALIGMNCYIYYIEKADPSYTGLSFALPKSAILAALQAVLGPVTTNFLSIPAYSLMRKFN